jgi:hypothetical protein
LLQGIPGREEIELIQDDEPGPGEKIRIKGLHFRFQFFKRGQGTFRLDLTNIDNLHQEAGALEVPEEPVPQALALMGVGDKPGNFSQDDGLLGQVGLKVHNPQLGGEGGEGKDVHPGAGRGEGLEERGLAGVGGADETHIGQDLQLQTEAALLPRFPRLGKTGRPQAGGSKVGIALAAPAAFGHEHTVTGSEQLPEKIAGVGVENEGAGWDSNEEEGAALASAVLLAAGLAVVGLEEPASAEVDQGAGVFRGFQDHITARPAVAAVGAAPGLGRGGVEAYTTGAAVSAPDGDVRLIRKGSQAMG